MDWIKEWVEQSPYAKALGVELSSIDEESAKLRLPYKDENSNPGQALHGGCSTRRVWPPSSWELAIAHG